MTAPCTLRRAGTAAHSNRTDRFDFQTHKSGLQRILVLHDQFLQLPSSLNRLLGTQHKLVDLASALMSRRGKIMTHQQQEHVVIASVIVTL